MSKHRNPLTPQRWAYLKALPPSNPTMSYTACVIVHVPDPRNPSLTTPKATKGESLNLGRNRMKRARRALRRAEKRHQHTNSKQSLRELTASEFEHSAALKNMLKRHEAALDR